MKILVLTEASYKYLRDQVWPAYCHAGMEPAELPYAHELGVNIMNVQDVDPTQLGKAKVESIGPKGVVLSLGGEEGTDAGQI